jgi:hypothetical protein
VNERRIVQTAIAASLLGHLVFLGGSAFVKLPGVLVVIEKTRQMLHVRSVDVPRPPRPSREIIQSYVKTLRFENPYADATGAPPEAVEAVEPPAAAALEEPPAPPVPAPAPEEGLAELKPDAAAPLRKAAGGPAADRPELFKPGAPDLDAAEEEGIAVPPAFAQEMFAFTPARVAGPPVKDFPGDMLKKGPKGRGKYGTLDEFVAFRVSAWRDPADGRGYFEIVISPGKDAAKLAHLPKEVVFLIDSSLSMRENRIEEFKKGVVYCLRNLNAGDRFNVYTFKDDIRRFREAAVSDPVEIGPAIRFMNELEASERTDLYEAFLRAIRTKASILPSYLVLLSDGRPTHGETSSAKLIEEISRVNGLKRPIFAFSGGRRVNRYLLDFLAYQNRGWSEYAVRTTDIRRKISEFYDKIRDPLLTNLRFQFSQVDAREVYPKHLPDLFRNAAFVVYGSYDKEKPFSMRLLGEFGGRKKEIIYAGDLAKAEKGGPEIARAWAFNKIYYLISRITLEGPDPRLEEEIRALSRRFGIQTPYDWREGGR